MCVLMCICVPVKVCMCVYMHACVCTCMHVCVCVCVCLYDLHQDMAVVLHIIHTRLVVAVVVDWWINVSAICQLAD